MQSQHGVDNLLYVSLGLFEDEKDVSLRCAERSTQFLRMQCCRRKRTYTTFALDFGPQLSTDPLPSRLFVLVAHARCPASGTLKIRVPTGSDANERTFGDVVFVLLKIFPDRTEQI